MNPLCPECRDKVVMFSKLRSWFDKDILDFRCCKVWECPRCGYRQKRGTLEKLPYKGSLRRALQ